MNTLYFKSDRRYSDHPIRISSPAKIMLELKPIDGYYIPNIRKPNPKMIFKNKGYRNLAYLLQAFLSASSQTLLDTTGASRSIDSRWYPSFVGTAYATMQTPTYLNFGGLAEPHDVTRYELFARQDAYGADGIYFKEEQATLTRLKTYNRYAIPATTSFSEVGLYLRVVQTANPVGGLAFLLCRSIITPSIERLGLTIYEDGYQLEFPANYTRTFTNVLLECLNMGHLGSSSFFGSLFRSTDGVWRVRRISGDRVITPDVKIGSSNVAPDPTHYHLQGTIHGSLASQSTAVEIDTVLQECRIVRQGTFTPTANITLGEVAQFIQVYDTGGVAREIMVARGIWDPPVTLIGGTTYTIGIVLRLG